MQKRLEAIAGQLYDGVLAPQDWYAGLDDLRHVLGASVFHFFTLDASGAQVPQSVGNPESQGLHAGVIEEYETHHAGNDLRPARCHATVLPAVWRKVSLVPRHRP